MDCRFESALAGFGAGSAQIELRLLGWCALDYRIYHVGLTAGLDLLANEFPNLGGAIIGDSPGGYGSAAWRQLVENAGVKIAIKREGQSAGNRSSGHHQRIGLSFA